MYYEFKKQTSNGKQDWKPIEYALIGLEFRRTLHADLNRGAFISRQIVIVLFIQVWLLEKWINYACIAVP